jgi:hypothetical protein
MNVVFCFITQVKLTHVLCKQKNKTTWNNILIATGILHIRNKAKHNIHTTAPFVLRHDNYICSTTDVWSHIISQRFLLDKDRIGGVMLIVLASSTVDRVFESRSNKRL